MSAIPATHMPIPAAPRTRPVWPAVLTGLAVFAALIVPWILVAVIGAKFEEIFRDFGVQLPVLTRALMPLVHAASNPAAFTAVLAVIAAISIGAALLARMNRGALIAILAMIAAWFPGAIGMIVVALFLPLVSMIESLQAGNKP